MVAAETHVNKGVSLFSAFEPDYFLRCQLAATPPLTFNAFFTFPCNSIQISSPFHPFCFRMRLAASSQAATPNSEFPCNSFCTFLAFSHPLFLFYKCRLRLRPIPHSLLLPQHSASYRDWASLIFGMEIEKKVVDEVSGWLSVFDDGSVDRTWRGPPQVKFMADPVPPHQEFVNGVSTRDLIVDQSSGLRVRIYLPEKMPENEKKLPILLHFHGGGFCISQPDWYMYYHTYTHLVRSTSSICVSVYLRLAPEHRLPAAIDDGFKALLWLKSVALGQFSEAPFIQDLGDFSRIFLIGDSSGGTLVHQVAARAGSTDIKPLKLAGAIPIHPGILRSTRSKSEMEQPESPFLTLDMVDKFLSLALPIGSNKDHPISCPMGNEAPPLETLKVPPFLLCVAEKDLILDTEMEYYEAMKKAGKRVELLVSQGMGHSFYLNKIAVKMDAEVGAENEKLFGGIAEFIKKHY